MVVESSQSPLAIGGSAATVTRQVGQSTFWSHMARGWESKSVELQKDLSESDRKDIAKQRLNADDAAKLRRKETLLLARAHLLQQMQASQHPRHREMLQTALAALEKDLVDLGATNPTAPSD